MAYRQRRPLLSIDTLSISNRRDAQGCLINKSKMRMVWNKCIKEIQDNISTTPFKNNKTQMRQNFLSSLPVFDDMIMPRPQFLDGEENKENSRVKLLKVAVRHFNSSSENFQCNISEYKTYITKEYRYINSGVNKPDDFIRKVFNEILMQSIARKLSIDILEDTPEIPHVYGFWFDCSNIGFQMEKIEGVTLASKTEVEKKKYKELMKRLIHPINNYFIFHNDIHSKNIIVMPSGNLALIDWGEATFPNQQRPFVEKDKKTEFAPNDN